MTSILDNCISTEVGKRCQCTYLSLRRVVSFEGVAEQALGVVNRGPFKDICLSDFHLFQWLCRRCSIEPKLEPFREPQRDNFDPSDFLIHYS